MIFNDCSLCNGDVNLFALYITKTDVSEERRKEGKISKKVLCNFHSSFKLNNKKFRFMSPLRLPASYSCLKSRFCSFDLHGKSLIELAIYGDCINIIYIVQYIVEHEQPKYKCHFRLKNMHVFSRHRQVLFDCISLRMQSLF